MNENEEKNLDLAFDLAKRKIDIQNLNHNSLESKIGILLGFVGVLAASTIALLQSKVDLLGLNIFTLGVIGIYLAFVFLVIASRTRVFLEPPDFSVFYSADSLGFENKKIKNQAVADMRAAFESNNLIQGSKAKLYNFAIQSFLASILLLFLGIIEK